MRILSLLLTLGIILGCIAGTINCYVAKEAEYDQDCIPGKRWTKACNDCFCSEDGFMICSKKTCTYEQSQEHKDTIEDIKSCEPGTYWKDKCNDCHCTNDGLPACTRKMCEEVEGERKIVPREVKYCEPGSTWMDGCDECLCNASGQPFCTYKPCPGDTRPFNVGGEDYKDDD